MGHERKEIRVLSAKYPKLQTLINYVNVDTLKAFHLLACNNADVININHKIVKEYHSNLESNLLDLVSRMKDFSYRPRKLYNDEKNQVECLYEDRLVEACMTYVLREVYEPRFSKSTFAYQNPCAKQNASDAINDIVSHENVKYVLACTIHDIFLNVKSDELVSFVRNDIVDENFVRFIIRFLQAGITKDFCNDENNFKNKNLMSPVLVDIYLHNVIDLWFEKAMLPELIGIIKFIRCKNQFVFLFEHEETARALYKALNLRLRDFDLRLKYCKAKILPEKTTISQYELSWFDDEPFSQQNVDAKI